MKQRMGWQERGFDIVVYFLLFMVALVVLYPLYFVVIASISDPASVATGNVLFWPVGITFEGYDTIFKSAMIWIGYRNTILYSVTGTLLSVTITIMAGYALSRKDLVGRNVIMLLFAFTMLFSGGLIPTYLVVKDLGLINTIGAMILPSAVSVFNVIVARTFFQTTIPGELKDAAFIDGCTNFGFFRRIVLPLSNAIIAVMTLFYCVGHWNAYFSAMIYLNDSRLYPLQLVLRSILTKSEMMDTLNTGTGLAEERMQKAEIIKYGLVIVSCAPILAIYPFLQKYFTKGALIGSLKG